MAVTVITARRRGSAKVAKNIDETSTDQNYALHHPEKVKEKVTRKAALISTGLLVIGLAAIIWGADLMLDGAVRIAIDLGISETLVGLTVVAIGTSAPELVTTIIATIKDERSLAFGNLIGSSTLNLTIILGTALLFTPHAIAVNPKLIQFSVPFMIATGLVCIPVFMSGKRISRVEAWAFRRRLRNLLGIYNR